MKLKKNSLRGGSATIFFMAIILLIMISSSFVTAEVEAEPEEEPRFIFAFDPHLPPIQYMEDGTAAGYSVEIMDRVAEVEGFEIEYLPMTLSESKSALEREEIDGILGINYSSDRAEDMEFSESFLNSSVAMFVAGEHTGKIENIVDLSGYTVAIQEDTVEYSFLNSFRGIQFNVASNQTYALELLALGRGDVFIGDRVVGQYLINDSERAHNIDMVTGYLLPSEYTIAAQKDDYPLIGRINQGLQTIRNDGSYSEIYNRWFEEDRLLLQRRFDLVMRVLTIGGFLILVVFIGGLLWNKQLKKQVDRKTLDLQKTNRKLEKQINKTKNSNLLRDQILENTPRGVIMLNTEGKILSVNPAGEELANMKGDYTGTLYRNVPLFEDLLKDRFKEVLEEKRVYTGIEKDLKHHRGKWMTVGASTYPLLNFENRAIGLILTLEDITKEKKLRAQLFEKEKARALNRIVAGIAHEIRNPVTSIKTFVELIPGKIENPRFRKEIVNYVPKELDRVNRLIENLIDYAKPKSIHQTLVYPHEVIQSCIVLYEGIIRKKNFNIGMDLEENVSLYVDPNQLKQVMINLILNGIEAMEEGSEEQGIGKGDKPGILIRSYGKENKGIIEVLDEGIGMTAEALEVACDPFYTTKEKGTGLGLALSKQYIEENGGEMIIESIYQKGTTISLIFDQAVDIDGGDQRG
ncbi:transporter substrate-binding domain-containing protein [Isachenkonia alkalipeptolytica]|uniref:histidine kinase n=1 Tax=Isachenkonia alkalipeptolytica TaxID=2565777 RepID=A0AA43XK24_9CLOT|nr:transporter substrate-binding domain-containing protein [Isachenkonia alkalipeptolytica]NBG88172.1 transporter substrate-binding domain-containing protein [Isachenkonia alkalipeptolytica]